MNEPNAPPRFRNQRWRNLALALLPLAAMLALALYINNTPWQGSLLKMSFALDTALIVLGTSVSALWLLLLTLRWRSAATLRRVTQAAAQSQKIEHQRFLRRLDHELKNPLTALTLGIENVRSTAAAKALKSELDAIDNQAQRLVRLTGDLRKVSAFDDQNLSLQPVNVAELLRDLESMGQEAELFTARELKLVLPAAPWPVPNINADQDLLQLALYNLLENAVKYSNAQDTVELRATDERDWVHITIADTGIGVPAADVPLIWDDLFRGSNAGTQTGSGIGLALVKRIITRHQGTLAVDSIEGTGTRITVSLPTAKKAL